MRDYHNIAAWERGHGFVKEIYKLTESFPKEETFGLVSQLRRAAFSIPVNIAEGAGRSTNKDFAHFLQIAIASANEVEYELFLSMELGFIKEEEHSRLNTEIVEIRKMLIVFAKKIKSMPND